MGLGVSTRVARIFSHESGRLFGTVLDQFIGFGDVRQGGLAELPRALALTMESGPDSVTILPGAARRLWNPYVGRAGLIVQGGCFTADDRVHELVATPLDALRLGADALVVAIPVRGQAEGMYLRWLTDSASKANWRCRSMAEMAMIP